MKPLEEVSFGVQDLITRLRNDGVQAGTDEAESITKDARIGAAEIIAKAQSEAEYIRDQAFKEIEGERKAGLAALQLAFRDATLKLKSEMGTQFARQVSRLVSAELADKEFLRRLILTVAARATPEDIHEHPVDLLVSPELFDNHGQTTEADTTATEQIKHLMLGITADMLRDGIELMASKDKINGIKLQLKENDLEVDLTEKAISDLLLKHLIPKFRDFAEGIEP